MRITIYDGAGAIGGNKILLEDEFNYFLDFGIPYSRKDLFYEEYLQPRSITGLLDLLVMDLLPPLKGLYRKDLEVSPEIYPRVMDNPLFREIPEIDGVLLSHAHLDHSGYISFLREDIPIYAIAMTAYIAKAMQDTAGSSFEQEVTYTTPREKQGKILEGSREWYSPRRFVFLDGFPEGDHSENFWRDTRSSKTWAGELYAIEEGTGNQPVSFHYVDHSIWGATAFSIKTSSGKVVYTGDLRFHGSYGFLSRKFIEEVSREPVKVLICEGTNTNTGEEKEMVTEEEVYEQALKIVKANSGLVIADFAPRNIERLQSFYRIARETGRQLVVLAKDWYLLQAVQKVARDPWHLFPLDDILIYGETKKCLLWELNLRESEEERIIYPEKIHREPGEFILCLSFFDIKHLIDIDPPVGGTYIYSSSEAQDEEQRIDQIRLQQWLAHFHLEAKGFERGSRLHASGHASAKELLEMIVKIKPEILIPVHTRNPFYFSGELKNTEIKVMIPEAGQTFII